MRRKLPPLNAVRAFEVVARLQSISLAAAELNVSAGAVSQQIKKLEDFYRLQLFIRRNNQLILTDVGRSVYAASEQMIETLATVTERLIEGTHRSSLIVSALPSFAVRWLNRHLPQFLAAHPDVRIDLRIEEDPVDFFRNRVDVRISYGEHVYPEFVTVPFRRDEVTVMCTPSWLEARRIDPKDPASLEDRDLIHIAWRTGFSAYPSWESWFEAAGAPRQPRSELGHKVDTSSLGIDLASAGCGIVLGQYLLAEQELDQGQLLTPFGVRLPLGYQYCAVYTKTNARSPAIKAFIDWLGSFRAASPPVRGDSA